MKGGKNTEKTRILQHSLKAMASEGKKRDKTSS